MKEYIKLLSKRVFLKKSNIFIILSCILIVLFVLIMNMKTQNFSENMNSKVEFMKSNIEWYTKELENMDEDIDQYRQTQRMIEYESIRLKRSEKLMELFEEKNFSSFYELYEEDLKETVKIYKNKKEGGPEAEADSYYEQHLTYIEYLNVHQLEYEAIEFPIFGLSFMVYMSDYILPIIILVSVMYILAQSFTLDYVKDINISHLYPIGKKKVFYTKLGVGIITSIIVFLLITLSAFVFASLLNQNMGLSQPYITTDADGNFVGVSLLSDMMKWMSLGVLFFVAVTCFMYVLAIWIKEDTALFLTGGTIVLGFAFMPMFIKVLYPFAHVLPTTYLNYISVVQGNLATQYDNVSIEFIQGVKILLLYIIMFTSIAYLSNVQVRKRKNRKKNSRR